MMSSRSGKSEQMPLKEEEEANEYPAYPELGAINVANDPSGLASALTDAGRHARSMGEASFDAGGSSGHAQHLANENDGRIDGAMKQHFKSPMVKPENTHRDQDERAANYSTAVVTFSSNSNSNNTNSMASSASAPLMFGRGINLPPNSLDDTKMILSPQASLLPIATQLATLSNLPQNQAPQLQLPPPAAAAASLDAGFLSTQSSHVPSLSSVAAALDASMLRDTRLNVPLLSQSSSAVPSFSPMSGLQQQMPSMLLPIQVQPQPLPLQVPLIPQAQNFLGYVPQHFQQVPVLPASAIQPSFLDRQLNVAQNYQSSYLPSAQLTQPALAQALETARLLQPQQVSMYQNSSLLPVSFQAQDQSQQQLQRLTQEKWLEDQLAVALLLSQQHQPSVLNNNVLPQMQMQAPVNQMEMLLRSIAENNAAFNPLAQVAVPGLAAAPSYPIGGGPQPHQNMGNGTAAHHVSDSNGTTVVIPSDVAPQGKLPASDKSKDKRWMLRYEELREYRQKYGHCRVPHGYSKNRKLSWWVMNQRAQYQSLRTGKKSWLTEDRVEMLDAIGFDWNPILAKSCDSG